MSYFENSWIANRILILDFLNFPPTRREKKWLEEITGLWNGVLWNETLINKNIIYNSNFLNSEQRNSLLSYEYFRSKWNLSVTGISRDGYSNIRVAIRDYRTNIANVSDFTNIYDNISLSRIIPK